MIKFVGAVHGAKLFTLGPNNIFSRKVGQHNHNITYNFPIYKITLNESALAKVLFRLKENKYLLRCNYNLLKPREKSPLFKFANFYFTVVAFEASRCQLISQESTRHAVACRWLT